MKKNNRALPTNGTTLFSSIPTWIMGIMKEEKKIEGSNKVSEEIIEENLPKLMKKH